MKRQEADHVLGVDGMVMVDEVSAGFTPQEDWGRVGTKAEVLAKRVREVTS